MFKLKPFQQLLIGAVLAAAVPLVSVAQTKDPVKIGLVSSKTGVWSEQGGDIIRGAMFAIDQANAAGGVDGRKVLVEQGDDESTPEGARRVSEKVARDGYNLLVGPIASSASLAIMQSLDRWDAAYFGVASKADALTGESCNARAFRTNHSDAMDIAMINEWTKSIKGTKFATLVADYNWGRGSADAFKAAIEAQGKKVSLSLYAPVGTKDFSPYIAQLNASDVDAIWIAEVGRDAIAFVKQAKEFGLIPKKQLIGHALILNFIVKATDNALDQVQGNTEYTPDVDTENNKAFVAAWKAKFDRLPTDNEAQAYNALQVIFSGVKLANSVKPAEVSKALSGAEVETIYGRVAMRAADHQLMIPNYAARVKTVDGVLRPAIEHTFGVETIPAASPLCKKS